MTIHGSARMREATPHVIETTGVTISDAIRRRAQSVINDRSIDPRWRTVISYALETNDSWLADLVRRADARETIIDTIDFSQTPEATEGDSAHERVQAMAELICRASDESAAALLVLMGTLENSTDPKVLANTVKHHAFTRCGELNLFGMVEVQIAVIEGELLTGIPVS